jgi:two-component system response regulator
MDQIDAVDILLVEDNPRDVELTVRALKKHNLANRLFVLEDGMDALDFIFARGKFAQREPHHHPKVVFLDIKLPKMNGLEVLRAIKSNEQTQGIPVVMVTSSQQDPDIKTAYELGANSYVVKPVEFDAFQDVMLRLGFYWLMVNQSDG